MRVLFVYPNSAKEIIGYMDLGAISEPIALEYVAAGAKMDGHETKLLDLRLHADDLDSTLISFDPDVVAVTGYSMHVMRNLEICARSKELLPGCKTVVGGHHVTLEARDFFEPQMDFLVIGEGVHTFRQILRRLESSEPVVGLPGVWARADDQFQYGGATAPYDINTLPHPDRTLAAHDRSEYHIDSMRPVALARTTVGCPYRCSFCSLWRIMDGHYYKRDIDDVVREFASIPEKHIHLSDDEPFVNQRRMNELADALEAAGIEKGYYAYCRIDSFLKNRDLMAHWHEIGLNRVFFGVESIFDDELDLYNKRQKRTQVIEGITLAKKLGIGVFSNFIIHPNYTEREFNEIKNFIREYDVDYPSFTIWTPIPGTADGGTCYDEVIEKQPNGRPNWRMFDLQHAVIKTKLEKQEFLALYASLYEVSPHGAYTKGLFDTPPVPARTSVGWRGIEQLDAEKRELAHIALAMKVLGGGRPPAG